MRPPTLPALDRRSLPRRSGATGPAVASVVPTAVTWDAVPAGSLTDGAAVPAPRPTAITSEPVGAARPGCSGFRRTATSAPPTARTARTANRATR